MEWSKTPCLIEAEKLLPYVRTRGLDIQSLEAEVLLINTRKSHYIIAMQDASIGTRAAPVVPEIHLNPAVPPQAQEHNKHAVLLQQQALNFQVILQRPACGPVESLSQ